MGVKLVVQGDDLGLCRAVNEGFGLAATEGVLTQASAMAPTPWFAEGAAVARRLDLAVGLHVTMTCEWEYLRWSPLTPGPSLRGADGTFHRTNAEVAAHTVEAETVTEALAQADRAKAAGLALTYVDPHMGAPPKAALKAVCDRENLRFMYRWVDPHHEFASLIILSLGSGEALGDRPAWFAEQLDRLGDGTHFVMSHPGVAGPELTALTRPDADDVLWADAYRTADLDALCAPEVRAVVERRGIELVAVRDL